MNDEVIRNWVKNATQLKTTEDRSSECNCSVQLSSALSVSPPETGKATYKFIWAKTKHKESSLQPKKINVSITWRIPHLIQLISRVHQVSLSLCIWSDITLIIEEQLLWLLHAHMVWVPLKWDHYALAMKIPRRHIPSIVGYTDQFITNYVRLLRILWMICHAYCRDRTSYPAVAGEMWDWTFKPLVFGNVDLARPTSTGKFSTSAIKLSWNQ